MKELNAKKRLISGRKDLRLKKKFFFFFGVFRAAPAAYGGSQARGQIGAVAVGLYHSHSNTGS